MTVLIVDGYNVIHSWPELLQLKESNLGHARDKLIDEMINLRPLLGVKVIIVFDAYRLGGHDTEQEELGGVQVIYTRQGETADTCIERLAGELVTAGNEVVVVTADWLEQRLVWGKGALRLSPAGLKRIVLEARQEAEGYAKERGYNPLDGYLSPHDRLLLEKWRRS
ncbi:NYN domain-containing protein [Moorellaceae bacterium AZ2]